MSTISTRNDHRLEGYRNSRGQWRWRVRGPEGIVDAAGTARALRDEAMEDGREFLRSQGITGWDEWADGLSEHLLDIRVPQIDVEAEARAAGVTAPDREAAEAVHRELEARRDAATEARRVALDGLPSAETTVDADAPTATEKTGEEVVEEAQRSPLAQQRRKRAGTNKEA